MLEVDNDQESSGQYQNSIFCDQHTHRHIVYPYSLTTNNTQSLVINYETNQSTLLYQQYAQFHRQAKLKGYNRSFTRRDYNWRDYSYSNNKRFNKKFGSKKYKQKPNCKQQEYYNKQSNNKDNIIKTQPNTKIQQVVVNELQAMTYNNYPYEYINNDSNNRYEDNNSEKEYIVQLKPNNQIKQSQLQNNNNKQYIVNNQCHQNQILEVNISFDIKQNNIFLIQESQNHVPLKSQIKSLPVDVDQNTSQQEHDSISFVCNYQISNHKQVDYVGQNSKELMEYQCQGQVPIINQQSMKLKQQQRNKQNMLCLSCPIDVILAPLQHPVVKQQQECHQDQSIISVSINLYPKKTLPKKKKQIQKLTPLSHFAQDNKSNLTTTNLSNILQDISRSSNETKDEIIFSFYQVLKMNPSAYVQNNINGGGIFKKIKMVIITNEMINKVTIAKIKLLPLNIQIQSKKNQHEHIIRFKEFEYNFNKKQYKVHQKQITIGQLIFPSFDHYDIDEVNSRIIPKIFQISRFKLVCTSCSKINKVPMKNNQKICQISCSNGDCLNRILLEIKSIVIQ